MYDLFKEVSGRAVQSRPKNAPIFEEPLILKLLSFEFLELTLII